MPKKCSTVFDPLQDPSTLLLSLFGGIIHIICSRQWGGTLSWKNGIPQTRYSLHCTNINTTHQGHCSIAVQIRYIVGVRSTHQKELEPLFTNPPIIIYPQIVFADRGEIISAGNFHGEYPAKALDYLAIGIHEMASMSERRIERLVNPAYSELPAFLVKDGGLNSGFMLAHCTAAALGIFQRKIK